MNGPLVARQRWVVMDVRVYEVEGPASESEAIAAVREQPSLEPVSRDTSAEPVLVAPRCRRRGPL